MITEKEAVNKSMDKVTVYAALFHSDSEKNNIHRRVLMQEMHLSEKDIFFDAQKNCRACAVMVSPDNPVFKSIDGMLLSKDGGRLLFYPGNGLGLLPYIDDNSTEEDKKNAEEYYKRKMNPPIPESVTEIAPYAFYKKRRLKKIEIPHTVKKISEWAFASSGIQCVILNEGLIEIGEKAFYKCCRLEPVTIPSTVTKIGREAFNSNPQNLIGKADFPPG